MTPTKNKRRVIFLWTGVIVGSVLAGNFILSLTLYNPAFIVPLYDRLRDRWFTKLYEQAVAAINFGPEQAYPVVPISVLTHSLYPKSHAAVIGTVTAVVNSGDGDWHLNVSDEQGRIVIAEIVPEYPLTLPVIGQAVKIWGITRYDLEHRWWELHPAFGWETVKPVVRQAKTKIRQ